MGFLQRLKAHWSQKGLYDKSIIILSVVFLAIVCYFIVAHRVFLTPDQFYILAFIVVLFTGHVKQFFSDWTPPLLLILSYEYLRGLVPSINHTVHFHLMPRFDRFVFHGYIPSAVLQQWLYDPNHTHWYDYAMVVLYLSHFVIPEIVAFFFWMTDRSYFKEYILGIVLLSYLTFLTYLVFPAAPPWMGAQAGIIPPVQHITNIILSHFFSFVNVPTVYAYFGANLSAAVPSLHAAYPAFTAIYIIRKQPKFWPLLVLYVLCVWFTLMYLGEHYFFDIFLGTIYAFIVFGIMHTAVKLLRKRRERIAAAHPAHT